MQMLKIYLLFCVVDCILSLALYMPSNILVQNKIIYNNNSSGMSYRNYVVVYANSFQVQPAIFYGINNYQTGNRFYYQNMQTYLIDTTKTHFLLGVNPIQITTVYKFSINYLAIDDDVNFIVLTRTYLNPVIYTNNKNGRSVTIQQIYNFTQANATGVIALRGFYLQSITQYYLETRIDSINNHNFAIYIGTLSDCSINRLDISLLFYYPQNSSNDYSVTVSQTSCFKNITLPLVQPIVYKVDVSVFLFGLTGFGGITKNSFVNIGWAVNNEINYTSFIGMNVANLQFLCYNFIQIFSLNPHFTPHRNPPNISIPSNSTSNSTQIPKDSGDSGSNSELDKIGIIAGSIVMFMFIVIFAIRRYWSSKYFQKEALWKTKKKLSLTSLYELPTLTF